MMYGHMSRLAAAAERAGARARAATSDDVVARGARQATGTTGPSPQPHCSRALADALRVPFSAPDVRPSRRPAIRAAPAARAERAHAAPTAPARPRGCALDDAGWCALDDAAVAVAVVVLRSPPARWRGWSPSRSAVTSRAPSDPAAGRRSHLGAARPSVTPTLRAELAAARVPAGAGGGGVGAGSLYEPARRARAVPGRSRRRAREAASAYSQLAAAARAERPGGLRATLPARSTRAEQRLALARPRG